MTLYLASFISSNTLLPAVGSYSMAPNVNSSASTPPLFLSLSLSLRACAFQHCDCPHCPPFFTVAPEPSSLDSPLPLQSAKHLGSFITPTSSPAPDIHFRCSQASFAFKSLDALSRHPLISQKWTKTKTPGLHPDSPSYPPRLGHLLRSYTHFTSFHHGWIKTFFLHQHEPNLIHLLSPLATCWTPKTME